MGKHTPGPWKFASVEASGLPSRIVGEEGVTVASPTWGDHRNHTILANAHLIAAAPDMLEALEYIVGWEPFQWAPETAREMAIAAINKARGES
jgi:hypothetical protein